MWLDTTPPPKKNNNLQCLFLSFWKRSSNEIAHGKVTLWHIARSSNKTLRGATTRCARRRLRSEQGGRRAGSTEEKNLRHHKRARGDQTHHKKVEKQHPMEVSFQLTTVPNIFPARPVYYTYYIGFRQNFCHTEISCQRIIDLKPQYSFGELEWISINLSKSAVFSLQTLENNLTSP